MTTEATVPEPARGERAVIPLRRPPIRQSTLVGGTRQHTFEVFTRRMADWWPVVPFSAGGERVRSILLEESVGGTVVEVWDDGTTRAWGDVVEWDPPTGFTMTWNVTGTPTFVTLRFQAVADRLTRVELEHHGWERLTEAELGADCALPGGYDGGAFHEGWRRVLDRFRAVLDDVPADHEQEEKA
jgi:hypothetical protein